MLPLSALLQHGCCSTSTPSQASVKDLEMPVMGGLAATEQLKSDERTLNVPIFVLTGATAERLKVARAAGCGALLSMPCAPDVVVLALEHVVHGKRCPNDSSSCSWCGTRRGFGATY